MKETIKLIFIEIYKMFHDLTGKLSWTRCTASFLIVLFLFHASMGINFPKESIAGIVEIIKFLIGAIVGANGAIAISNGISNGLATKQTVLPKPPDKPQTSEPEPVITKENK